MSAERDAFAAISRESVARAGRYAVELEDERDRLGALLASVSRVVHGHRQLAQSQQQGQGRMGDADTSSLPSADGEDGASGDAPAGGSGEHSLTALCLQAIAACQARDEALHADLTRLHEDEQSEWLTPILCVGMSCIYTTPPVCGGTCKQIGSQSG